jgi:uncharacterized MAPEG superfamily protein
MNEIYWLVLAVILTFVQMIPYVLERAYYLGLSAVSVAQPNLEARSQWALRSQRAYRNALDNLIIFSILILIVNHYGGNEITLVAAKIYFGARLVYAFVYTFGVPYLRQISFMISVGALVTLVVQIFNMI